MKKSLILMGAICAILLSGCSSNENIETEQQTPTPIVEQKPIEDKTDEVYVPITPPEPSKTKSESDIMETYSNQRNSLKTAVKQYSEAQKGTTEWPTLKVNGKEVTVSVNNQTLYVIDTKVLSVENSNSFVIDMFQDGGNQTKSVNSNSVYFESEKAIPLLSKETGAIEIATYKNNSLTVIK